MLTETYRKHVKHRSEFIYVSVEMLNIKIAIITSAVLIGTNDSIVLTDSQRANRTAIIIQC